MISAARRSKNEKKRVIDICIMLFPAPCMLNLNYDFWDDLFLEP
jgi:hypothetical protein